MLRVRIKDTLPICRDDKQLVFRGIKASSECSASRRVSDQLPWSLALHWL